MTVVLITPAASAADQPKLGDSALNEVMDIKGVKADKEESAETKQIIESNAVVATAAANVCGARARR
ncbi:hypothetical protein ACFWM0_34135 [Streptomyces sp. NPDC058405]|uniref:hypothetical protein n=1 Tax=Streptomyces sp. NPDC058405 TaxID=3346482 RepID=UPI003663A0C7